MAGYFRQLAQQAAQPASRLHPRAALPYWQAQHWGLEEFEERFPLDTDSSLTPMRTVQLGPKAPTGLRATSIAQDPVETVPSAAASEARAMREVRVAAAHELQEEARLTVVHDYLSPRLPPNHDPASLSAHQRDDADASLLSPRHATLRQKPSSTQPIQVATNRPSTSQALPDLMVRPAHAVANAAPEVHIHIGRIELTAVTPPTARKRESAEVRKPMSLDEYLEQRRRNAP